MHPFFLSAVSSTTYTRSAVWNSSRQISDPAAAPGSSNPQSCTVSSWGLELDSMKLGGGASSVPKSKALTEMQR
jgi:hypothetical protein